jgi:hypothetical protein
METTEFNEVFNRIGQAVNAAAKLFVARDFVGSANTLRTCAQWIEQYGEKVKVSDNA